jgi:hypothetical protein
MTFTRMVVLAILSLAATIAAAVAPTHPVYNPPVCKFLLGAFAATAAMAAREAVRYRAVGAGSVVSYPNGDVGFVVSFDDLAVSLALPDGGIESARWDELESISIEPYDDPFLIWTGPFFVSLKVRERRVLIPAFSVGLDEFLERLLELPGIDRDPVEVLLRERRPSPRVVWTRRR